MKEALFYLVVFLANVIQGITGFAGTILAMPFSVRLVGMDVAVPVLNVLGLLSGIYVFAGNRKHVDTKEIKRMLAVTVPAVIAGILIKYWLSARPGVLYMVLGAVVTATALLGLWKMFVRKSADEDPAGADTEKGPIRTYTDDAKRPQNISLTSILILAASGLVHGMFVCGGPLLISYLALRIKDKTAFRATISTVWIFLNGIILISQMIQGAWNADLLRVQLISVPFLLAGMLLGGVLYRHMSQRTFMVLTYVLLFIAGLSLFFK